MTAPTAAPFATSRSFHVEATVRNLAILTAVSILACFPVLLHGLPDWSNDGIEHVVWGKAFFQQLWNGEWYPRWLTDMNAGYGSPVLFIYPPAPLYATAFLWPLFAGSDTQGWYTIGLSAVLSILCSSFAVYFWIREKSGDAAALFAGLICIFLPYHLAVNVYTRGAIGELWAVVWPPLILLAVDRLRSGSRFALFGLALSYAGLILSHLPTTLCFSLVPPAAAFFLSEPGQRLRVFVNTFFGMVLGILLGSIYLMPALAQRHDIQEALLIGGWFDHRRWWLTQIQPLFDARMRLLLLTVVTVALLIVTFRAARKLREAAFYFWVSVVALFLATQLSGPLWRALSILESLQFPTRFLQILVFTTPAIAGLSFPMLRNRGVITALGIICATWIAADVWAGSKAFSVWRPFPADNAVLYGKILKYRRSNLEYWPRWAPAAQDGNFPEFESFIALHPPKAATLTSGPAPAVHVASPRRLWLDIDSPQPSTLTVNHFYYTGWKATTADGAPIDVSPSQPEGFLRMSAPAGRYRLDLELSRTTPERAGQWISFATLLGMALIAAIRLRQPH
ncbi:MAG TPA: 6-pyruvoyl-tetrahydropterin synthase-related protein [Bryobacteraceae bacterium]|nr:6-pyruvoyl-tetrahydropterin synthase-related protein [Bryobacteraceae bacterium]